MTKSKGIRKYIDIIDYRPPYNAPSKKVPVAPDGVFCTEYATGKLFIAARRQSNNNQIMIGPYQESLNPKTGKIDRGVGDRRFIETLDFDNDFVIKENFKF